MPNDDLLDVTPSPTPAPKREFVWPDPSQPAFNGTNRIPWATGQTFAQALAAGLPAMMKAKTLGVNAEIEISVRVREV